MKKVHTQLIRLVLAGAACWFVTLTSAAVLPVTNGLAFRVDASAITGLNLGDPVTTWNDLSGNNYHAVTRTGFQNPTYQQEVIYTPSGQPTLPKPVVRFNTAGGDDSLQLQLTDTASLFGGDTDWTTFVVFAKNSPNISGFGLIGSAGNPAGGITLGSRNDTSLVISYSGYGDRASIGYHDGNTKIFDVVMWEHNQSTLTDAVYTNGVFGATQGFTISPTSTVAVVLGTFEGNGGFLNGDIAEILVYKRLLTATEQDQVYMYLHDKWYLTPEPGTAMLLLVGGGLCWRFRRLRRVSR